MPDLPLLIVGGVVATGALLAGLIVRHEWRALQARRQALEAAFARPACRRRADQLHA